MSYSLTSPDHKPVLRVIRDEDEVPYDTAPRSKPAGFTMIPSVVKDMKDGYAVAVFEAIARHANADGECWPSIALICELTGWSKKIVLPAIQRLVSAGAIIKQPRKLHGMDQSNLYHIAAYEQVSPTELPVVPTVTLGGSHGDSGCHPQNHELEPIELKPKEQERVNPPTPQKARAKTKTVSAPDYSPEFLERFWSVYPKHERNNRVESWSLWQQMTPNDREAAIAAVPLFVASRGWREGYIPGAQVWLRNRRWEDPPQPQSVNGHAGSNGRASVSSADLMAEARRLAGREPVQRDDVVDVNFHVGERR